MASAWEQIGLVIAGALIGIVPTVAIERMKWRHQDHQAWREERRKVYADFLVLLSSLEHDTVQLAREMSRTQAQSSSAESLRHPATVGDDLLRELVRDRNDVAERMITSYETLKLVATDASRLIAEEIIAHYNHMLVLARNGSFYPDLEWSQTRDQLSSARQSFRETARHEIMGQGADHA